MCSKPNRQDADVCEFCGARLTPVTAPLDTIKPGETPTPKKTADLERTLPGWLRDVRKAAQDEVTPESQADSETENQAAFEMEMPDFLNSAPEPAAQTKPEPKPENPLDFLAGLASSTDDEEEVPDWLTSLRAEQPQEQASSSSPAEGNLHDLLASMDSPREPEAQQPAPESWGFEDQKFNFGNENAQEEQSFNFESETPDWLAALKGQQADTPVQPPPAENVEFSPTQSGDLPSWLNDLAGSDSAGTFSPEPVSPSNQPESTFDAGDTPDWLASLSADVPPAASKSVASDADTPDWLASLSADVPPSASEPAAQAGDTPDWLVSLSADVPPSASEPAAETGDTPDWLASLSADVPPSASEAAAQAGDTPDWLASLSADVPPSASEPAAQAGDTPDWLASLSADAPAAASVPAAETGDTPDWLASLSADVPAATSEPAAQTGDTPDWLASFSADIPVASAPTAETGDAPDWLASFSADVPPSASEPAADTDMSDWLSQAVGDSAQPASTDKVEPTKKPKAFQTGSLEEARMDVTPDWLANLGDASASGSAFETVEPAEATGESGLKSAEPVSDSSSVFDTSGGQPFAIPAGEQNVDSILSMDVPDWLAGFTPGELEPASGKQSHAQPGDSDDDDLAPANLPSWVQALRPVESVASDTGLGEDEQSIEKAGPLAGFRAVLPFSAGLMTGRKTASSSMKLNADKTQQEQAALLEALVHAEGTPRPVAGRRKVVADRLLRWVVAAVLLLTIFVPAALGSRFFAVPNQPTRDLSAFISTIYGLDSENPVLIVMDYQPAMSGEMDAALSPVLNDLMIRGSHLGFVSTLPTGPLMVSRTMDRMQSRYGHAYQAGVQYVDLGYLPGDAAGIRAFVTQPHAAIGLGGFGENLWNLPMLSNIKQMSDFAAVIIVTDNPDNGRIWVEQTGSALNQQPMLMVISAQAEPMLIPYYDSGQVRGLLTGLSGAAVYEATREQPGLARVYWDSYGFGLIAAQLLILTGGVWSLVAGIRTRRQKQEQEEA
ncbi:MAG: hypothetical protein CVU44_23145 [Chloroflexi bacterium HGW-Chloroflexi-6]|nr:MAG: hypothetical protein CVU44_23145 [Chloroflexi bacterium HGW-Chloroflexi-6]